jgi:sec-independent protein translocase protein TatA
MPASLDTLVSVFQVGAPELLLVLVIALIVLGPKRLPEAARSVGRGVREMRDALSSTGSEDEREEDRELELAERERELEERERRLSERESAP